jgi:hypothetical protein
MEMETEIVNYIKENRNNFSDEEIAEKLEEKFPDIVFNFSFCAKIDKILYPENGYGGYWRAAYNYPQENEELSEDGTIAKNCGFFTFDKTTLAEKIADWIKSQKGSEQEIQDKIEDEFPNVVFHFSLCSEVDSILYPEKGYGGYWRAAYNFPVEGQYLQGALEKHKAINCGFFTFGAVECGNNFQS